MKVILPALAVVLALQSCSNKNEEPGKYQMLLWGNEQYWQEVIPLPGLTHESDLEGEMLFQVGDSVEMEKGKFKEGNKTGRWSYHSPDKSVDLNIVWKVVDNNGQRLSIPESSAMVLLNDTILFHSKIQLDKQVDFDLEISLTKHSDSIYMFAQTQEYINKFLDTNMYTNVSEWKISNCKVDGYLSECVSRDSNVAWHFVAMSDRTTLSAAVFSEPLTSSQRINLRHFFVEFLRNYSFHDKKFWPYLNCPATITPITERRSSGYIEPD